MTELRLGEIQFLNSWPVTYALRKGRVPAGDLQVVSATPADLNRRLLTGELDASAVSSIMYLRHQEEFVPVPGLCIRSDAGVHSVLVVSFQPLTTLKGRTIGVSNQGATTPVLLKALARHRQLKINLETTPLRFPEILQEYPAALLIGDEALQASDRGGALRAAEAQSAGPLQWWDLGEAWNQWTGKPFVYALWVMRRSLAESRPALLERLKEALIDSRRWGREHESELIAAMRKTFPFEANFLREYLAALSYDFNDRAWEGLIRFAQEAESAGELARGASRKLSERLGRVSPSRKRSSRTRGSVEDSRPSIGVEDKSRGNDHKVLARI